MKFKEYFFIATFALILLLVGTVKFVLSQVRLSPSQEVLSVGEFKDNQPEVDGESISAKNVPFSGSATSLSPSTTGDGSYKDFILNKVQNMPAAGVPVLMYHHIGPLPLKADAIRTDLTVSLENFSAQIQYLNKSGYQAITTEQLYLASQGKFTLPKKPICLTFDDGYDDNFVYAVPVLIANKMMGSFAIITQFIDSPGYVSAEQIKNAEQQGMELISHSQHHIDFTDKKYTYSQKSVEILESRDDLISKFGINTNTFVYPYGHKDVITESILQNNHYTLAFTTNFGTMKNGQDLLAVPRVRVHGQEDLKTFINVLNKAQGKVTSITR